MIRVIAIGKKHEPWVAIGIDRYEKRLQKPWNMGWVLLPHSALDGNAARHEESARILRKVSPDDFLILLDEKGTNVDSSTLPHLIERSHEQAKHVVVVIGGAYGVDDSITNRANFIWSLSKLVFPHQLVRLILTEQIYRAQEIACHRPYHHG